METDMKRFVTLAVVACLASPALAQDPARKVVPTIPESQIAPADLSSPYEFLSAATSASEFIRQAGALAEAKQSSAAVKATASALGDTHTQLIADARSAGKTDGVEIAKPSVDGEQQGLLGKLQGLDGAEFDRALIEAYVFVHQRAIALYRGYAEKADSLGKFAAAASLQITTDYSKVAQMATMSGAEAAEPQKPAVAN
jgi:putative membrane protein